MLAERANLDATRKLVKHVEASHTGKCAALIAFGIPLSMIGPLVFTGIAAMFAVGQRHPRPFHFWPTLWVVTLISLPILYLLAWMIKGSILEKSVDAIDSMGGGFGRGRAVAPFLLLEMANIGPRMVLYGLKLIVGRRRIGATDIDRAALAVHTLASVDGGISPAKLLRPGDSASILERLLAFLMFHDLIDISKTGDRVWLRSDACTKLEKL